MGMTRKIANGQPANTHFGVRMSVEEVSKLDAMSDTEGVTRSEMVRYMVHRFHKLYQEEISDSYVAINLLHGALTIAPRYYDTREECAKNFPHAVGIINLKDYITIKP